jgi:hypothetical protein
MCVLSMNHHLRAINFLDLAIGIFVGVMAIAFADIQLSLSAIDPADARTWPNMDPRIRYYLMPVVALVLVGAAFLVELCLFRLLRPRTTTRTGWLLLGVSYSLITSYLLLRHFLGREVPTDAIALGTFFFCLVSVHYWLYEKESA